MATFLQLGDPGRKETPPRLREEFRQRRPRAAAATEFARALDAFNLSQLRVARLFGVNVRTIRRWRSGDRTIPTGVGILIRLMVVKAVSVEQLERAAAPISARTNGSAEPRLPAPLLVAPTPAPTLANPDLTTAQKVW